MAEKFTWGNKAKHDVNKLFSFQSRQCVPLHLKQTNPPMIWIFTEGEGDGIESRLLFKIFCSGSTTVFSWIHNINFSSQRFVVKFLNHLLPFVYGRNSMTISTWVYIKWRMYPCSQMSCWVFHASLHGNCQEKFREHQITKQFCLGLGSVPTTFLRHSIFFQKVFLLNYSNLTPNESSYLCNAATF